MENPRLPDERPNWDLARLESRAIQYLQEECGYRPELIEVIRTHDVFLIECHNSRPKRRREKPTHYVVELRGIPLFGHAPEGSRPADGLETTTIRLVSRSDRGEWQLIPCHQIKARTEGAKQLLENAISAQQIKKMWLDKITAYSVRPGVSEFLPLIVPETTEAEQALDIIVRMKDIRGALIAGDGEAATAMAYAWGQAHAFETLEYYNGESARVGRKQKRAVESGGNAKARKNRIRIATRDAGLSREISTYLKQNPGAKNSTIAQALLDQSEDKEQVYGLKKSSLQKLIGEKRHELEL